MTEDKKIKKNRELPIRFYVSCPICSSVLLQGEYVKNTIVKCEGCKQRIIVNIENGHTSAFPLKLEENHRLKDEKDWNET